MSLCSAHEPRSAVFSHKHWNNGLTARYAHGSSSLNDFAVAFYVVCASFAIDSSLKGGPPQYRCLSFRAHVAPPNPYTDAQRHCVQ